MLTRLFKTFAGAAADRHSPAREYVERYRTIRNASSGLMHKAIKLLHRSDFEKGAKALGLWRRGRIEFDQEEVAAVLTNYLLLEHRCKGVTAIERFRSDPTLYDAGDAELVERLCTAQFRLLRLVARAGTGCSETVDLLTSESGMLVDVQLSETGKPGLIVATHVWDFDDFWMTTGAAVTFSEAAADLLARRIRSICQCELEQWSNLGTQKRSAVVALIIRCCLDSGAMQGMRFA